MTSLLTPVKQCLLWQGATSKLPTVYTHPLFFSHQERKRQLAQQQVLNLKEIHRVSRVNPQLKEMVKVTSNPSILLEFLVLPEAKANIEP